MYSREEGGVSKEPVWKPTPPSTKPPALITDAPAARQLELLSDATAVCRVVVREVETRVSVPAMASGEKGSRLTARTTKTSRSSGLRFKSTDCSMNVLAASSEIPNPIDTRLDDCLSPVGMMGCPS